MTKQQATRLFNKYNPADAVVRSPNGRARMRKPLDTYAKAAVNLYGMISREELADIFNSQNDDQTTADEIFTLLLPNVLKARRYGFYKELVVDEVILDDFEWVDYLQRQQAGKPRYVPPKDQFIEFEWVDRWQNEHWSAVLTFMWDVFGSRRQTTVAFWEIQSYMMHNTNLKEVVNIMEKHDLLLGSGEFFQHFLDLLSNAVNNTRMWENNGYTPQEAYAYYASHTPKEPEPYVPQKVGRNQRCPCGSGKKYKDCCLRLEQTGWSQLTPTQCRRFYETWYKLLVYVNHKHHITDVPIALTYPAAQDEIELSKVRDKLWEQPSIIEEYIAHSDVTDQEAQLLRSWQQHHIGGQFILMEHTSGHSLFMQLSKGSAPKVYGVKGMTTAIAAVMRRQLPVLVDTVLLPFDGKIIYDSYMHSTQFSFGPGLKQAVDDLCAKAKDDPGIITTIG